jgi:hypothetical protein
VRRPRARRLRPGPASPGRRHDRRRLRRQHDKFVAPHYTTDGHVDLAIAEQAITAVATELGVPETVSADDFYRKDRP